MKFLYHIQTISSRCKGIHEIFIGIIWINFRFQLSSLFAFFYSPYSHALLSLFAYYTYCLLDSTTPSKKSIVKERKEERKRWCKKNKNKKSSKKNFSIFLFFMPTVEQVHNILWVYPHEKCEEGGTRERQRMMITIMNIFFFPFFFIHQISELLILGVVRYNI